MPYHFSDLHDLGTLFIHIEFYLLFAIIQNKPILTKTSLKQLPQYLKKFWQTIGGRQLPVF